MEIIRRITAFLLIIPTLFINLRATRNGKVETVDINGSYAVTDSLGRQVTTAGKSDKKVGIFFFLWSGAHGIGGPYDNEKIVAEHPEALLSEENWMASGGGDRYEMHFWGEPLFGYYLQHDQWVIRKQCQMLTDAGIDFLVFDTTNILIYEVAFYNLLTVWYEYFEAGWNVPKLAFYTNYESGLHMNSIYDTYYNSDILKQMFPRLDELWFRIDDGADAKPMIIGDVNDSALRSDVKDYFRIKANQWPNDKKKKKDGFPWMEFDRSYKFSAFYKNSCKDKSIVNVSVAQHCDTQRMSDSAWYGSNDHGRSWHNGKYDKSEGAILNGYNFQEQWDFAYGLDPDIVFVTGWNEWIAQRCPPFTDEKPVLFIDNATAEYSRDIEPAAGVLGDTYYMQLISNVARFKNKTAQLKTGTDVSIDINGDFSQWDNSEITSVYRDYSNDTVHRNFAGYGELWYSDSTGRNDIVNAKVTQDSNNVYFYVETASELTSSSDEKWMTLLVNTDKTKQGYSFYINRTSPENGKTDIEVLKPDGSFEKIAEATVKFEGKKLMLSVSKTDLGYSANEKASFEFKWADNCDVTDVFSFYKNGDAAPYGRLNYQY